MTADGNFWRSKRVLVTGHTGFKGGWLCLWLQSLGAEIVGYSLDPPTAPSFFEVARVAHGMTSLYGDVRDGDALLRVFNEHRPEIVFHMAAQPLVRASYEIPVETYATNVMGTVHLLEAVRQAGEVQAVVVVTTDKCYENREWVWGYRENEPMGGYDPYSNSKGCAELVTSAYRDSFFNPQAYAQHGVAVASARAGNVIGGGDWGKDRLVPDTMRSISAGRSIVIRNPHAIRPWQHVLEPLSGYMTLVRHLVESGPEFGGGWNFGPPAEGAQPVSWIVDRLCALWGGDAHWTLDDAEHPHEAHYLKLDCSKANTYLGWHPRLSLAKACEWIVEWHKACESHHDMRQLSEEQIARYISLPL